MSKACCIDYARGIPDAEGDAADGDAAAEPGISEAVRDDGAPAEDAAVIAAGCILPYLCSADAIIVFTASCDHGPNIMRSKAKCTK